MDAQLTVLPFCAGWMGLYGPDRRPEIGGGDLRESRVLRRVHLPPSHDAGGRVCGTYSRRGTEGLELRRELGI